MSTVHRLQAVMTLSLAAFLSLGHAGQTQRSAAVANAADIKLHDATLTDQEGHPIKFASEAVGGRIVAIDFIYTTCTTACPLVSAAFKRLQEKLGDRLGRDFWLISISLDPVVDTPVRIKSYAERYKAKSGWIWLTGNQQDVERVLGGLGTTTANFREHPPLVMAGDGLRGQWNRFKSLPDPGKIQAALENLLAARKQALGRNAK